MKTLRKVALVGIAAVTAFTLVACQSGGDGSNNADGGQDDGVTIETQFGPVTVPAASDDLKVVALGWSDAEVALALGVQPIAVYDWQSFGEENKGVGPWASELFGDVTPTVFPNDGEAPNFEAIDALEPDLILNLRSDNNAETHEQLSTIAPTVAAPADTLAYSINWQTQTEIIGEALGKAEEATALISSVEETIANAAADHPEFDGVNAAVASKFGEEYGASFPGDARWDILAELGFALEPKVEALTPSEGFYAPVSGEQLGVLDTEVLVFFPIFLTLEDVENDPLIAALPVVQDGRTVFLDPDGDLVAAFSAGSPVSIPLAIEEIVPMLADAVSAR
ncbi:iron-siderophore ABC transporter substrate-binding protein [Humidisolicoccus flavus]|uniref:iron-siderophore ABC transporter substrate-binding protein n=1 Tax=Humidisolicoccus flavus TaxID=3111414 RepID=UPI003249022C